MFEVKKGVRRSYKFFKYPERTVQLYQDININNKTRLIASVGLAKCDKNDKYDSGFGMELAGVRAEINMLKTYEKLLISLTKQPEWRKEKAENKSKTLKELVGKWAIRIKPPEGLTDHSYCDNPIFVRKVTAEHCIYTSEGFSTEHIFSGKWLDNNWIDYDKLMSKE